MVLPPEVLDGVRSRLGQDTVVCTATTEGLHSIQLMLGADRHGDTAKWGCAAADPTWLLEALEGGVRQLMTDRECLVRRVPLPGLVRGPAVMSAHAAGVFVHECFGHTSEADNYLEHRGDLGISIGDWWTSAGLSVRDTPTTWPLAGSYRVDDEGIPATDVTLVSAGRWVGLLTDVERAGLSGGVSTGHGRGPQGAISPRCSVLTVAAGDRSPTTLLATITEGWLLGTPIGGFSRGAHVVLELLWVKAIRDGVACDDVVYGPAVIRAHKATLARQISAIGSDVFVNSSPFRCVKNGWEVGSSLLAPSMLMDQVVLRPMHSSCTCERTAADANERACGDCGRSRREQQR